jgi:hypothetical protein
MHAKGPPLKLSRHYFMPVLVLALFNGLHLGGLKTFEPWPQVVLLWGSGADMFDYVHHFHFYRLMVASPGLWLEDAWPGYGFSAYVTLFLSLSSVLFGKIHEIISGRRPQGWAWVLFLSLFLLMNGRGAIGWAGWLLCVHACLGVAAGLWPGLAMRTVLQCIIGLSLSLVSSGIFVCTLALFAYFVFVKTATRRKWNLKRLSAARLAGLVLVFVLVPIVAYFVFNHLVEATTKAMLYYGDGLDGLIGVATHGFASQVDRVTMVHVFALGIVAVFFILFFLSGLPARIGKDVVAIILIALGGGIFGLTILTLAFPLIIIAMGKLVRFRVAQGRTR